MGSSPSFEDAPDVVTEGVLANPSWPFSNSSRTRSRAASRALCLSSSASRFNASNRAFCRLISSSCVTNRRPFRHFAMNTRTPTLTHQGPCRRTLCRRGVLFGTLPAPALAVSTAHTRRTASSTRSLDVAATFRISFTRPRGCVDSPASCHSQASCILHMRIWRRRYCFCCALSW